MPSRKRTHLDGEPSAGASGLELRTFWGVMPTPRHARRLRRLRVAPPLPYVVLRTPWEGPAGHAVTSKIHTTSGRASDGRAPQLVPEPLPTSVLSSGEGVGGHGAGDKVWTAAFVVQAGVGTSQGGPHFVAGLVPEQKGSRARRSRCKEVRCRYLDGRSQDLGAAHPPRTLGWARRLCGALLARRYLLFRQV